MATLAPKIGFKFEVDDFDSADLMWRICRERYHELIDLGVFTDERVELIHGYIIQKLPSKPPHILVHKLLFHHLTALLSHKWHLSSQNPIATDDSEPEPDIAVIRGEPHDYAYRLPQGDELGLVIEISRTTLVYDQRVKTTLYAAAGIAHYWIIHVEGRVVELYSNPVTLEDSAEYLDKQTLLDGETLILYLNDALFGEIPVSDILPPL